MSPVSFAASVPEPIAIPISAAASAGASLIPSPTIAVKISCAREFLDQLDFVGRRKLGVILVEAEILRDLVRDRLPHRRTT